MLDRLLIPLAGLAGAAGVASAAAAAHGGGHAGAISAMLLAHAPAFLAIGLAERKAGFLAAATLVLAAGLLLFCADLAVRDFGMARLFPMAAPIGGTAMIAGWLGIAAAGLFGNR